MDGEVEIPCTKDDVFKCTCCGNTSTFEALRPQPWEDYFLSRRTEGFDRPVYFYCPHCEDTKAKVFTWGDASYVLGANVEIVQQEQLA